MNCFSDRVLLFPKVNEAKLNEQKLQRTFEMRHRIMAELKRNNTASLYNIHDDSLEASLSLGRKKRGELGWFKVYPSKKKSASENQARSAEREKVTGTFQENNVSIVKMKRKRLVFEGKGTRGDECEQERLGRSRKQLRVKTEGVIDHQALLNLPSSPPQNLKPTINIKSILGASNDCTRVQKLQENKFFRPKEKLKRYYHKVSRSRKQAEGNRLKQIQLKFTLLHGWRTDQQDCRMFT